MISERFERISRVDQDFLESLAGEVAGVICDGQFKGVLKVVRHFDDEFAVGAECGSELFQVLDRLGDMLEYVEKDNPVEIAG